MHPDMAIRKLFCALHMVLSFWQFVCPPRDGPQSHLLQWWCALLTQSVYAREQL